MSILLAIHLEASLMWRPGWEVEFVITAVTQCHLICHLHHCSYCIDICNFLHFVKTKLWILNHGRFPWCILMSDLPWCGITHDWYLMIPLPTNTTVCQNGLCVNWFVSEGWWYVWFRFIAFEWNEEWLFWIIGGLARFEWWWYQSIKTWICFGCICSANWTKYVVTGPLNTS